MKTLKNLIEFLVENGRFLPGDIQAGAHLAGDLPGLLLQAHSLICDLYIDDTLISLASRTLYEAGLFHLLQKRGQGAGVEEKTLAEISDANLLLPRAPSG